MKLVVLLVFVVVVFFVIFALFIYVFPYLPSPPALCRYLLLRVAASVQQLPVPLQHVCCSSCCLSDLLASHSSQLMTCRFFFLLLPFSFFFCFSFSLLVLIFLVLMVWLVLLCSRTRVVRLVWLCSCTLYAGFSPDLPEIIIVSGLLFSSLCLTVCEDRVCISLG